MSPLGLPPIILQPTYLPTHPPTHLDVLPTYLPTYLGVLPTYLFTQPCTRLFKCITYLLIYPPTHPTTMSYNIPI
jgi:hypothetical protein